MHASLSLLPECSDRTSVTASRADDQSKNNSINKHIKITRNIIIFTGIFPACSRYEAPASGKRGDYILALKDSQRPHALLLPSPSLPFPLFSPLFRLRCTTLPSSLFLVLSSGQFPQNWALNFYLLSEVLRLCRVPPVMLGIV